MNISRLKGEMIAVCGSQKNFADAMRWHQNKVSKMMTGKYSPTIDEVALITEALGLDDQKYLTIFLDRRSPVGGANNA